MNAVTGFCEGCFRTIDEIAGWSRYDDAARRSVLRAIEARRGSGAGAAATEVADPQPPPGPVAGPIG